ncbi:putative lipoprotein [Bifidobacterium saguini DSM 23967]|nr:putative lipoprotein [Bifidobacterium saguini DSM 23967]
MGTGRGLESLRSLLDDQARGLFGPTVLLGAAITDPVARMPRPLVEGRLRIASVTRVWRLPYIRGLELEGFPTRWPSAYARLLRDVDGLPR